MNTNELIGLEVCQAKELLTVRGETNFKFVYYTDRKQQKFDKEFLRGVREDNGFLQFIVCRYLFEV